jgi:hypothetical protein
MNTSSAAGVISTVNLANVESALAGIGALSREPLANVAESALAGIGVISTVNLANVESALAGIGGLSREPLANVAESALAGIGVISTVNLANVESALAGIGGLSRESLADVESALAGIGGLSAPAGEPVIPAESLMEQQFAEVPAETLLLLLVGLALARADLAEVVLHELLVFVRLALGGYAWLSDELPDANGLAWMHLVMTAVRARKSGPRSD